MRDQRRPMHRTIGDFVAGGLERGWLASEPTTVGELMAAYRHKERALVAAALQTGSQAAMRDLALHRGQRHFERKAKRTAQRTNYFSYRHTRRRAEDLKAEIMAARLRWAEARPNLDLDDGVVLDLSPWAAQLAELDKLPHRWPPDYEPPPPTSSRDIAALVHAPRPGPLAGIAQRAA